MATQSSAPIATTSASPTTILDSLHDDVLRVVLLRTSAADHLHLRLACHRIRNVLDSPEYRTERSRTGWAEVHTTISETEEGIDEEYDYVHNSGIIVVDSKGGTVTYTLVPRKKTSIFHEVCDAISGEMQEMGCKFCDTRGRPRLASVKEAMKNNDTKGYFLYINTFELESDYRNSTWVGAKALRSLLTETKLAGTWSLAVYIPIGSTQFNQEESTRSLEVKNKRQVAYRAQVSGESLARTAAEIKEEEE